jgi:hypothetical protein
MMEGSSSMISPGEPSEGIVNIIARIIRRDFVTWLFRSLPRARGPAISDPA